MTKESDEKNSVGIDAYAFRDWSGGIDFIATIADALSDSKKLFLLIDKKSFFEIIWYIIKNVIKSKGNLRLLKRSIDEDKECTNRLLEVFRTFVPDISVIEYTKTEIRGYSNRDISLEKALLRNKIDIILPSLDCRKKNFSIPRIGYVFDFQHKYLSELFEKREILYRESVFKRQINNSKYLIVNSESVKKDIEKFYPNHSCKVYVLPFKPFQKISNIETDIGKYNLPDRYYIISNQFWEHKAHAIAFKALNVIYNNGMRDLHIVCTGNMTDYRNLNYISSLKLLISKLECSNNIHLLGYVPKIDQMAIMKNAIGLIQPTLFEGGPGGGALYNAVCQGKTCLLSNIPVNMEADSYPKAFFFPQNDVDVLSELMIQHVNDKDLPDFEIEQMILKNKKEYASYLSSAINDVISESKRGI